MPLAELTAVALQLIKLGISAAEAAQVDDEAGARGFLRRARSRVQDADDAWAKASRQAKAETLEDTSGLDEDDAA